MNSTHNSIDISFDLGFWHLLKETIMSDKDTTSLKKKILVAKRILTPIIQDLMTDALVQTEIEKLSKIGKNKQIEEKNINILFSKIKSDETGHVDENHSDNNEWVTKILREISRDLDQPFERVLSEVEEKHLEKRSLEEDPSSDTLLEKLISVYQHLGEIIEHLKYRCGLKSVRFSKQKSMNTDVTLNMSEFPLNSKRTTDNAGYSEDNNAELRISKGNSKEFISKIFHDKTDQEVVNYQCRYKDVYALASRPKNTDNHVMRESICSSKSIICVCQSQENDKCVTVKEYKSAATSFSKHKIQEQGRIQPVNKVIVNKCLENLDQVRKYLESLRIDEESNESPLSAMGNIKHDEITETRSNLICNPSKCISNEIPAKNDTKLILSGSLCPNGIMEDKFEQRAKIESNLKTGDSNFIEGIHILQNRNERETETQLIEEPHSNFATRQKYSSKESRIPKLIYKTRATLTNKRSSSDMKIILTKGEDSQQKSTNLLIFNPQDPSKSIIKMKNQENVAVANSNEGVSKNMKSSKMVLRMNFFHQNINASEKENMWNPFWPGYLNIESKMFRKSQDSWFYQERNIVHVSLLLVNISNPLEVDEVKRVFLVTCYLNALLQDFSFSDCREKESRILFIYFNYEDFCNKRRFRKRISDNVNDIMCFHRPYVSTTSVRIMQKLLNLQVLREFKCQNSLLSYYSEINMLYYMDNLFRFMSFLKGNLNSEMYKYHPREMKKEYFLKYRFVRWNHYVRNIYDNIQNNSRNQQYTAYFLSCSVERGENEIVDSSAQNRNQWDRSLTYPIWKIKKSKYYDLPCKKMGNAFIERNITEQSTKKEEIYEYTTGNESRISEIRLCPDKLLQQKVVDCHNIWKKSDIKRKVSFRDEVDFSKFEKYHREGSDVLNNVKMKKEKPISTDIEDAYRFNDELSDFSLRDSLMLIDIDKSEHSMNGRNSQDKLAKMSCSFEDRVGRRRSELETERVRTFPKFNDEILSSQENLHDKINEDNVNNFTPPLLNSKSSLDKKKRKYMKSETRTYTNRTKQIKPIENVRTKNLAKLETTQYYDYKGKAIEHMYNESGSEIEPRDINLEMFDTNGNLRTNLYTKKGRRINVIYNSNGDILKKPAVTLSNPKVYDEHSNKFELKNLNSLHQLFEIVDEIGYTENQKVDGYSFKNRSDSRHGLLSPEFNHTVKSSKTLASKEFHKDIDYPNNGDEQQEKILQYEQHEKTTNINEGGNVKSDFSISWLNELLSGTKIFAKRKRDSILKNKSKSSNVGHSNLKLLYDGDGNVIKNVYDSREKLLTKSSSGNLKTLIPFLFDNSGLFMKGRYTMEKNELKCVFDKDKNIIEHISLNTLNEILTKTDDKRYKKSSLQSEIDKFKSKIKTESSKVSVQQDLLRSKIGVLNENSRSLLNTVKLSQERIANHEKYREHLLGGNEKLLTEIHDFREIHSEISNKGTSENLLPYLQYCEKIPSNQFYHSDGEKLKTVYNKNGNINISKNMSQLENEKVNKIFDYIDSFNKIKHDYKIANKLIDDRVDHDKNDMYEINAENNRNCGCQKSPKQQKSKNKRNSDKLELLHKTFMKCEEIMSSSNSSTFICENKHLKISNSEGQKITENRNIKPYKKLRIREGMSLHGFCAQNGKEMKDVYDFKKRSMMKIKSSVLDKIVPFLFDRKGMLFKPIFDARKKTKIYDNKRNNISKILLKSCGSEQTTEKDISYQDCIYDRKGNIVKEIYDRKSHPLILKEPLKEEDVAPFIFHQNGIKRRDYNENGYEIGSLYDYKGNLLEYRPLYKRVKKKVKRFDIRSKSGHQLKNFYDSEGTIIIALYNDDGRIVCSVEKGKNNANILSKYLFDKQGFFLKDKFFNFRGARLKKVYDSNNDIIHSIRKTYSQKSAHNGRYHCIKEKERTNTNMHCVSKMKKVVDGFSTQRQGGKDCDESRNKVIENFTNMTSHSAIELNFSGSKLKRPISAYFSNGSQTKNEYPGQNSHSCSSGLISTKTCHEEYGRLLTKMSESALLGYSASENTALVSRYLFDDTGNSLSGRLNVDGQPLKHIYDSKSNSVNERLKHNKENEDFSKTEEKHSFHDNKRYSVTNVGEINDKKITETIWSHHRNLKNQLIHGCSIENFSGSEINKQEPSKKEILSCVDFIGRKTKNEQKQSEYEKQHRKRFPFISKLKERFLAVVFENLSRSAKSAITSSRNIDKDKSRSKSMERSEKTCLSPTERIRKYNSNEVLEGTENKFTLAYKRSRKITNDENGSQNTQFYESKDSLICRLCSTSGNLAEKRISKTMYDKSKTFRSADYESYLSISTIYTNKKLVTEIHGENKNPAKVDSGLIYLVSKQSLPSASIEPVFTQMHYTSEGTNCYDFDEFKIRGHSKKRTSECVCQQCQDAGRNENFIGKLGGEFMTRLSKLTMPIDNFLTRNILRKRSSRKEKDGTDSLEALINNTFAKKNHQRIGRLEQKSCSSSCISVQIDDKLPISRKVVLETLMSCLHLNSSSNVVGKVSNMMLQHFTTSILREIKQAFYRKLDVLQYRRADLKDSSIFESETPREDPMKKHDKSRYKKE